MSSVFAPTSRILRLKVGGKLLVYLDNAASSQMPQPLIDRLVRYQTTLHAAFNSVASTSTEAEDDLMHAPISNA